MRPLFNVYLYIYICVCVYIHTYIHLPLLSFFPSPSPSSVSVSTRRRKWADRSCSAHPLHVSLPTSFLGPATTRQRTTENPCFCRHALRVQPTGKSRGCNFYIRFQGNLFHRMFPSFVSINISLLTGSKNSPNSNKLKISLRFPPTSNLANDRSSGEEFGGKVDTSARTKERRRRGESYGGLNYSSQIKRSEPANIIYRPVGCLFRVVIKARTRKPIIMKLTNYPLVQRLDLSLPLPPPPYTSSRESHRFSHPKPVQPVHPTSSSVLAP